MFTVYGLHSPKYAKIYIGYTSDLDARMLSHNKLATEQFGKNPRPPSSKQMKGKYKGFLERAHGQLLHNLRNTGR